MACISDKNYENNKPRTLTVWANLGEFDESYLVERKNDPRLKPAEALFSVGFNPVTFLGRLHPINIPENDTCVGLVCNLDNQELFFSDEQ